MALSGFKKQFNKANQMLSEKVGGAKGTELSPEFIALEKLIQAYEKMLNDVVTKTMDYIQPNRGFRLGIGGASGSGGGSSTSRNPESTAAAGNATDNATTMEGKLANYFYKHGTNLGQDTASGPALVSLSEAFFEMADERKSLEANARQNFIDPLSALLNNELKQISHHLKKVESRRLDFDYKKRKGTSAEVEDAESKFSSSVEEAKSGMENFIESDTEHVQALLSFVSASKTFHLRSAEVLSKLEKKLSSGNSLKKNSSLPKSFSSSKIANCAPFAPVWNEQPAVANSSPSTQPTFNMKKKHDDSQQNRTATCRVLFDFAAENEGELDLKEGETVKLIEQVDENWYFGEIRGRQGHFPLSYVEVLVPLRN